MYSPLRRRFVLDFGKQTAAWRRLQWPDCSANENEMKQGHIGLDSEFDLWLPGHFKLRIFRLSHGASRTGCEAFSFLLQRKLGV